MSRKSDKHKPNHSALIANFVNLDRRQQPTKKKPDPEQPDMGKYLLYVLVGLLLFYVLAIIIF